MLKYKRYAPIVLFNKLKRLFNFKSVENKYVFILGATHAGTTLLNEILSTSLNASSNNNKHTREGQLLPTVREHMFTHKKQWEEDLDFDWEFVKKEWLQYWDTTCPILVEKSPPNLLRAQSIEKVFDPSFFIVFVRNPYAHCETFIRKNKYSPTVAAEFVLNTLRYQKRNLEQLKNVKLVSYEMLVDNPDYFKERILNFLPELEGISLKGEFSAHNYYNAPQKIKNFNPEKIKRLTSKQIEQINKVFNKTENRIIIEYFDYSVNSIDQI